MNITTQKIDRACYEDGYRPNLPALGFEFFIFAVQTIGKRDGNEDGRRHLRHTTVERRRDRMHHEALVDKRIKRDQKGGEKPKGNPFAYRQVGAAEKDNAV